MAKQELGLSQAIGNLREELIKARTAGSDAGMQFSIDSIELELKVVAGANDKVEGGVKWWVISGGVEAGSSNEASHTLKLTMSLPKGPTGKENLVSDTLGGRKVPTAEDEPRRPVPEKAGQ